MKNSARSAALVLTLFTSTVVSAGGDPDLPGPEGVVVDISGIFLEGEENGTSSGGLKNVVVHGTGKEVAGVSTSAAAADSAAANMEKANMEKATDAAKAVVDKGAAAFDAIVNAMRPGETIPPLENDRIEFYVSEKVMSGQFERNAGRYNIEDARLHLAFLHSEERDSILQGGLALDTSFTSAFRLSFGTRAYVALLNDENKDSFAAAVGAEAAYQLPFEKLPLEFGASFYYAPDVLTFGAGERAIDTKVNVILPFRSKLSAFAGIRYLQIDTRPGDEEIDNRLHLGVRWDFL